MNTASYKRYVMRRFLSDLLDGENVGASDGKRYDVSWLANYATELREAHGLIIDSVPRGKGLKHYYILRNKDQACKVLAMFNKQAQPKPNKAESQKGA